MVMTFCHTLFPTMRCGCNTAVHRQSHTHIVEAFHPHRSLRLQWVWGRWWQQSFEKFQDHSCWFQTTRCNTDCIHLSGDVKCRKEAISCQGPCLLSWGELLWHNYARQHTADTIITSLPGYQLLETCSWPTTYPWLHPLRPPCVWQTEKTSLWSVISICRHHHCWSTEVA